ncbi:MAG: helix-turn-helix transcriptional regulator, partial [Bacteroidaceae bacterium]|nr:helix-turn-helix transcriptional regulator [Bacteroidaceae bacterium]
SLRVMAIRHEIVHVDEEKLNYFVRLFDVLYTKSHDEESPNKHKSIDSILCAIAFELFDIHASICGAEMPKQTYSSAEHIFQNFIKLLSDPKHPYLSVNEYASELNVTPKYFSSVCKKLSGKTASEIINEEVIKSAQIMLRDNTKSVKQIADALNFTNQSHFGTFFRRYMGMSPHQFRGESF